MSQQANGTASCLSFPNRPGTPENVKKYRKSFYNEPGKRSTHWGLVDDNEQLRERIGNRRLGKGSDHYADSVTDAFSQSTNGFVTKTMEERKQALVNARTAHTFVPNNRPRTKVDDTTSKDLIYTTAKSEITEDGYDLYKRSHNRYHPGEQRSRHYDWKSIDPNEHRFGVSGERRGAADGVASCLRDEPSTNTNASNPSVAAHRMLKSDMVGKSRYRGLTDEATIQRLQQQQEARKNRIADQFSARDCIQGGYSETDLQPDSDVGRAVRVGYRNNNTSRTFGAPTVRTDMPAPARRSLADGQNYGDDVSAGRLLRPSKLESAGLQDADVITPWSYNSMKQFIDRLGYNLTDTEFNKVFSRAAFVNTGDANSEAVSLQEFLDVLNERFKAVDRGQEPSWWY